MSYCLNPACSQPQNPAQAERCQTCGANLRLRNRYRVLSSLGQGGFGATFLARDEALPGQPNCVIKQLRPNTNDPTVIQMARELFEREAKTLGKIGNHPQIPRLLDYFADNQSFYLIQEYISGATLQQEVKRNGPFTEVGVKQFLSEILPLMEFVHSQKVIHRDIKPSNIIRRHQDGKLVLIDFGAVKDQVSQSILTEGGQTALTSFAIGTAGFAPPEQMAMRPVYASDIYALGVTCIYLLTGKSPKDLDYDPATGEMCWQKHIRVSDRLIGLLKKMLEVSVRHRYQTAGEVLQALEMEPYLDSLANSMTVQPIQRPTAHPVPSERGPSTESPAARAARSIRARQTRDQTSLEASLLRHPSNPLHVNYTSVRTNNSALRLSNTPSVQGQRSSVRSPAKASIKLDATSILNAYVKGKRDFTSQDLSKSNLQRVDLSGAIFHEANLVEANFQGAMLANVNFGRACLHKASFKNACLTRAYFSHADLQGADLRGADLTDAYLSNANLRGANLCGANLTGAKVTEEQLAIAKTNWATVRPEGKRGLWQR